MTPARRIRRIQRWIAATLQPPIIANELYSARPSFRVRIWGLRKRRLTDANRLFAAELAWLCEYAIGLREGILQLSPVSGPVVSEPTFVCGNCQRDVPLSQGAADKQADICNDCWDACSEDP